MQLSRSRGISHHSHRDFAQERADLAKGYNNYKQWAADCIAKVSESQEYSTEQKANLLKAYKVDLEQKQQEYNDALRQINLAEEQFKAEYADEYSYGQGCTDAADIYCGSAMQADGMASYEPETYCGTALVEESSDGYSSDNDYANGI